MYICDICKGKGEEYYHLNQTLMQYVRFTQQKDHFTFYR